MDRSAEDLGDGSKNFESLPEFVECDHLLFGIIRVSRVRAPAGVLLYKRLPIWLSW